MEPRLCAISVDLDEIPNYYAIHGLDAVEAGRNAVYDVAVGRLLGLAKELDVPLTLFAIGQDLARPEAARALAAARDAGHEIANHSLHHRYDLTRLSREEMCAEVRGGADAIEAAVGVRPAGFRAPGYTINDSLFEVLEAEGVAYDSSVFPCPAYYGAKTAAIALIALRGRRSHSVVDTPAVLLAPTRPYRVGTPYFRRGRGLLELPIQVTRGLRLPYIGTSLTLGGPAITAGLTRMCLGEPLVNLELHGIDVLDGTDGLRALEPHQPDVRVPIAVKLAALREAVSVLRNHGYRFVTLETAARSFQNVV